MAEVARVAQSLDLARHPALLLRERLLERERLASQRDLVVEVREGAVDWIPDEHDQLRGRNELRDAFRRQRMEQVARARLADDRRDADATSHSPEVQLVREVTAVPRLAAPEVAVEEADLFPGRPDDRRMLAEVCVQRRRAALLRPEDQEIRQGTHRRRCFSVRPESVPGDDADRARHRRDQPCPQLTTRRWTLPQVFAQAAAGRQADCNSRRGGVIVGDRTQRIKGKANETVGKATIAAGNRSRNRSTQAKGAAKTAKGKAQQTAGKAKSTAKKVTR